MFPLVMKEGVQYAVLTHHGCDKHARKAGIPVVKLADLWPSVEMAVRLAR